MNLGNPKLRAWLRETELTVENKQTGHLLASDKQNDFAKALDSDLETQESCHMIAVAGSVVLIEWGTDNEYRREFIFEDDVYLCKGNFIPITQERFFFGQKDDGTLFDTSRDDVGDDATEITLIERVAGLEKHVMRVQSKQICRLVQSRKNPPPAVQCEGHVKSRRFDSQCRKKTLFQFALFGSEEWVSLCHYHVYQLFGLLEECLY